MTDPEAHRRGGRRSRGSDIQRASGDALGHGFTIAAAIGLFLWIGDRVDRALGSSPVFALGGMLLGGAAGFYRLYVYIVATQSAPPEDEDENSGDRSV